MIVLFIASDTAFFGNARGLDGFDFSFSIPQPIQHYFEFTSLNDRYPREYLTKRPKVLYLNVGYLVTGDRRILDFAEHFKRHRERLVAGAFHFDAGEVFDDYVALCRFTTRTGRGETTEPLGPLFLLLPASMVRAGLTPFKL